MSTIPTLDPALSAALRDELVAHVQTTGAGEVVPLGARRRRRTGTRLALVAASLAGLAVGASVLMPGQSAYAGWSATPTPLVGDAAQQALQGCGQTAAAGADGSAGLAEQRGRWVLAMVRGQDGAVTTCLRTTSDDGASIGQGALVPAAPDADSVTVLIDNGIFAHASSDPRVVNGWFGPPEMEGQHLITGVAGPEVTDVVLSTTAGEVTASLEDGLWAAWWPVPYPEQGNEAGADDPTSATLTLRDGSTVTLDRQALEDLRDL